MDSLYEWLFGPSAAAANVSNVAKTTPGKVSFGPTDSMPPLPGQPDKAAVAAELARVLDPKSWNTTVTPEPLASAGAKQKSLGDKLAEALSGLSASGLGGAAPVHESAGDILDFYKMANANIPAWQNNSLAQALPRGGR